MYSNKKFNLPKKRGNTRKILGNLPQIKAKPDFEQKMAARFAIELDREVRQRNISWLKKSNKIKLPDIIS